MRINRTILALAALEPKVVVADDMLSPIQCPIGTTITILEALVATFTAIVDAARLDPIVAGFGVFDVHHASWRRRWWRQRWWRWQTRTA